VPSLLRPLFQRVEGLTEIVQVVHVLILYGLEWWELLRKWGSRSAVKTTRLPIRMGEVQLAISKDVLVFRWPEGCPSHGRGA
jgi:hypothetical protein